MMRRLLAWCLCILEAWRRPGPARFGGLRVSLCLILQDQVEQVEGLVGEAVAAAAALGDAVAEVVAVDEGSADGTGEVLARLQRRHPAIKTLRWPDDTTGDQDVLGLLAGACAGRWMVLRLARAPARPALHPAEGRR